MVRTQLLSTLLLTAGCAGQSTAMLSARCAEHLVRMENVCVSQPVADFVMCIRSRGTVELQGSDGKRLALQASIAGQSAETVVEARQDLEAKYSGSGSTEGERQVIERCATLVGADGRGPRVAAAERAAGPLGVSSQTARGPVFFEDFRKLDEGLAPDDWIVDDGLGVVVEGRDRCLGGLNDGNHRIITPAIALPEDFRVSLSIRLRSTGQQLELAVGDVQAKHSWGSWSLTGAASRRIGGLDLGRRTSVVLEKRGPVFKMLADGQATSLSRIGAFEASDPLPIIIGMPGSDVCLYSLAVDALSPRPGSSSTVAVNASQAPKSDACPSNNGTGTTIARERFIRGEQAFAEQRYSLAACEWSRAYEADERPRVLFNLAAAYEKAGDIGSARTTLQRLLVHAAADTAMRQVAQGRLSALH